MDREREDLSNDVDALYIRLEGEIAAGIDRVPVSPAGDDESSSVRAQGAPAPVDPDPAVAEEGGEPSDSQTPAEREISADGNIQADGKTSSDKETPAEREIQADEVIQAKPKILDGLQQQAEDCRACPLHEQRNKLVFGVGDPECSLMFVGEGPGVEEDRTGIPFVGRAGQLLTRMIEAMGYTRETVYIANVIKCHPRGNRTPGPREIEACRHFLESQIQTLSPKVIVALGAPAAKTLLHREEGITSLRGNLFPYPEDASITVVPTFHPAYLLRNESEKGKVWQDLQKAMALLKKA